VYALVKKRLVREIGPTESFEAWARLVSNQRPLACEATSSRKPETPSPSGARRYLLGELCLVDYQGLREITGDLGREPILPAALTIHAST
jgi:hypothetical protein